MPMHSMVTAVSLFYASLVSIEVFLFSVFVLLISETFKKILENSPAKKHGQQKQSSAFLTLFLAMSWQ